MSTRRTSTRMLVVSAVTLLALALGGSAVARWGGSGGGAGSATAGTTVAVTLTPGTPTGGLYPGGQANVTFTVTNPNLSAVRLASFELDLGQGTAGFSVDAGHSGCAVTTLTFATQTNAGTGWTVPAKVGAVDGTLPVTLTNALAMGLDAAAACQGATVTIYLVVGP